VDTSGRIPQASGRFARGDTINEIAHDLHTRESPVEFLIEIPAGCEKDIEALLSSNPRFAGLFVTQKFPNPSHAPVACIQVPGRAGRFLAAQRRSTSLPTAHQ
jgi:hypothetical protein